MKNISIRKVFCCFNFKRRKKLYPLVARAESRAINTEYKYGAEWHGMHPREMNCLIANDDGTVNCNITGCDAEYLKSLPGKLETQTCYILDDIEDENDNNNNNYKPLLLF